MASGGFRVRAPCLPLSPYGTQYAPHSLSYYTQGTSIEQDARFFNQNKKLLAKMAFPKCFDEKVDLRKVKLEVMQQWVTERVTQLLGFEDDIVASLIVNLLEPKVDEKPDPRQLQVAITGFLEKDAPAFTQELWELLLSAQAHPTGIPTQLLEKKKQELEQLAGEKEKLRQALEKKRREASGNRGAIERGATAAADQLDCREAGDRDSRAAADRKETSEGDRGRRDSRDYGRRETGARDRGGRRDSRERGRRESPRRYSDRRSRDRSRSRPRRRSRSPLHRRRRRSPSSSRSKSRSTSADSRRRRR